MTKDNLEISQLVVSLEPEAVFLGTPSEETIGRADTSHLWDAVDQKGRYNNRQALNRATSQSRGAS